MVINDEIIQKIANLARLALTSEEKEKYQKELTRILSFFDSLSKVDTEDVEAISQVTWLENITRTDEVSSSNIHDDLVSQAPAKSENWSILVKNVL